MMPASVSRRGAKNQRPNPVERHYSPAQGRNSSVESRPVPLEPREIATLAYSYWEARGCQGGSPEEDWLCAEQQLRTGRE